MDARRRHRRSLTKALATAGLAALTVGCGTSTPSRTVLSTPVTGSPAPSSAPATSAGGPPPCTLAMLTFAVAPWEGAMGTAYSGIVVGLTSGPQTCTLRGAVEVALGGPSAPVIAADSPALPTDLVLRQEPLDPAAPCRVRPCASEIVPLGSSPVLTTTFPTPACATPSGPARLEVGPRQRRRRLTPRRAGGSPAVRRSRHDVRGTVAQPGRRPAGHDTRTVQRWIATGRCRHGGSVVDGVSRMTRSSRWSVLTGRDSTGSRDSAVDPAVVRRQPRRDREPDPPHGRPARARDDRPADDRTRRPRPARHRRRRRGRTCRDADAVHPGFGFLAENADFAEAVDRGRHPMGRAAAGRDPGDGRQGGGTTAGRLARHPDRRRATTKRTSPTRRSCRGARRIGYPILVKPAAGGGGKGMRTVRDLERLRRRSRPRVARPRRHSATTG